MEPESFGGYLLGVITILVIVFASFVFYQRGRFNECKTIRNLTLASKNTSAYEIIIVEYGVAK